MKGQRTPEDVGLFALTVAKSIGDRKRVVQSMFIDSEKFKRVFAHVLLLCKLT